MPLTRIQLEKKPMYQFLIVYYCLQEIFKNPTKPQEFVYQKPQTIKQQANGSKLGTNPRHFEEFLSFFSWGTQWFYPFYLLSFFLLSLQLVWMKESEPHRLPGSFETDFLPGIKPEQDFWGRQLLFFHTHGELQSLACSAWPRSDLYPQDKYSQQNN